MVWELFGVVSRKAEPGWPERRPRRRGVSSFQGVRRWGVDKARRYRCWELPVTSAGLRGRFPTAWVSIKLCFKATPRHLQNPGHCTITETSSPWTSI